MLGWSQFPNYKARVSGTILGGYGLGAAVFNMIATSLVNPDNESPHDKDKDGGVTYRYFRRGIADNVPEMLRWLSLIYFVLSTIGVLLLTRKSIEDVQEKDATVAPSIKAGLKTKQFYILSIAFVCSTSNF